MRELRPSRRIGVLPRSGVREAMDRALRVPDALRLDIGDPDFATPPHIVEAAARAAAAGFTHYSPTSGLPSLRELIAARRGCAAERVVVTTGGCGALFASMLALLDPGDEVLVPDPGWPQYVPMALQAGAVPVPYPLDAAAGFEPDLELVESRVGERARALLVNSPANPSGAVLAAETVVGLVELAARRGLWILSDECYDELVLDGEHVGAAAAGGERVVSVYSFSKTYAMTGWRVGYAVAPADVAPLLALAQEPVVSCPSTVAQKAAEAALAGPQGCVEEMRSAYRRRRDRALAALEAAGVGHVPPRGAFYLLVDVDRDGESSADAAQRLLEEERVAVVPGSAFGAGGEGRVRVSLAAADEVVAEGVERLARSLAPAGASA